MNSGVLRILTALVGIPIVVGSIWYGGVWFELLVALIAIGAQIEFYQLMRRGGFKPSLLPGIILGILVLARFRLPHLQLLTILVLLVLLFNLLRANPSRDSIAGLAVTLMGCVYPVWMISFLSSTRSLLAANLSSEDAFVLMLLLFVIIWTSDSVAYYVGRAVGKRPLAPSISPNKTVEGSVGGLIGAILVGVLARVFFLPDFTLVAMLMLSVIGGVVGQIGDLVESFIKRSVNAKDSASILPGHGGLLDRFDAFILAAPLYYLYLEYVLG